MNTGDLILFNSITPCACMVSLGTCSKWNHVAIVLKDFQLDDIFLKGIHVLQCGLELVRDVYGNKLPFGVHIQKLENIQEFYPRMYYRHLNLSPSDKEEFLKNLKYIIMSIKNASYDMKISSWIELIKSVILGETNPLDIPKETSNDIYKNPSFVCSSMVAYLYAKTGLMQFGNWKNVTPQFFAKVKTNFLSDLNRI